MPRKARVYGNTGIYHVIMRGNERKLIFHDDEDRERFLMIMEQKKKFKEFKLYAYCLMDNHIHLLIKEEEDNISRIMKRINTSYATYYNKKYERIGHVFQDRYKSEAVEDDTYLLEVLRYIHNNPVKANIVNMPLKYPWSSFNIYCGKGVDQYNLMEVDEVLGIYSEDRVKAIDLMIDFTSMQDSKNFLDIIEDDEGKKAEEKKIHEIIEVFLKKEDKAYEEVKNNKHLRNELIKEFKQRTNSSIRTIARVSGIDRNSVQKI
ncbi:REP-associated tyrosine transposase [Alkaliphilus hydrothermalis]|uniref:REP element-mobilizing transposase RayT n=1 Tax=Alkaliphilus hydrothermalis TaxID=1482730 RepID=A0ABS2NPD2_9FIRM|nr:transposase [Alkaliphilus hydrothermalis]MBM7614672.1 REP element-mobilizing transposase RayT [Alkaliphilus hydrothermalis]